MKHRIGILLVCLFAAPMAAAQDSGWFATAQFGVADYDTTQKGRNTFFGDTDDDAFAWAAGLGYQINRHFGVRAMFERATGLATINRCPPGLVCPDVLILEETDFNNFSLVAMPRLPLTSKTSLYATLGLQYWDADSGPMLPDDDGFEFLFGGGLDYSLTRHFGIGAELQASTADYIAGRFVLRYSF